jgi:hypothetical protein
MKNELYIYRVKLSSPFIHVEYHDRRSDGMIIKRWRTYLVT